MITNEHQRRIWKSMIDMIQCCIDCQACDFYAVVGKIEGALDAAEIKNDAIISQWYDFWLPLETRRAVEGNNVDTVKAIEELVAMKNFLLSNLE